MITLRNLHIEYLMYLLDMNMIQYRKYKKIRVSSIQLITST